MKMRSRGRILLSAFGSLGFLVSGCGKPPAAALPAVDNLVVESPAVDRTIGEGKSRYRVLGEDALKMLVRNKRVHLVGTKEADETLAAKARSGFSLKANAVSVPRAGSLVVGYPIGLLGQSQVFGGVVTKVSDAQNSDLGRLKLSDLTPIHVTAEVVSAGGGNYVLALLGCPRDCGEGANQSLLIATPIVGVDSAKQVVMVDLAPLGEELNLIEMMDPKGDYTKLKTVSSKVSTVDFSVSTLVFDIDVAMQPIKAPSAPVADTVFTVRWYLRLASAFSSSFTPRPETPGVGYFMTERVKEPRVQRLPRPFNVGSTTLTSVKYYIKNVPTEFRGAFTAAFDDWNAVFNKVLGKKLVEYEYIEKSDPRYAKIIPGDARYFVLEWDLDNNAPYGGLGPSIANQHTGEIFSANVLVQGPRIIELYKKWFGVSLTALALREDGRDQEADQILLSAKRMLERAYAPSSTRFSLGFGNLLSFRIPSQLPSFEDPLFQRDDFDELPTGFTFQQYMDGYFRELVAHEIGHNLGLRHNFHGNLGGVDAKAVGGVSHSVMEYLGRGYRHLNRIGAYDVMAIEYGYAGVRPTKLNLYCTDEHVGGNDLPKGSAECSRDDATNDPFSFFEMRLAKSIGLLTDGTSTAAPTWTVKDMGRELGVALTGLGLYASSAEATAAKWLQFFGKPGRPTNPTEVKAFVVARVKGYVCNPALNATAAAKATPEAKLKTETNLTELRKAAAEALKALGVPTPEIATCT